MMQQHLKIGQIDYINTLPFFTALQRGAVPFSEQLVPGVPSKLNQALSRGEVDISFISSAEYLKHRDRYTLLSPFGIGATHQVKSVCLYVRGTIQEMEGHKLALTPQSLSSANLVKVLCCHYWHVSPEFETFATPDEVIQYQAFLLIGDDCLRHPTFPGYTTIDLAQAWYYATGLPFVFGVVAARNEVMKQLPEKVTEFQETLSQALVWAKKNPQEIEQVAMEKCRLPVDTIREYYTLLQYEMTSQHHQGLEKFANLLEE